jgi:hypothetical protein
MNPLGDKLAMTRSATPIKPEEVEAWVAEQVKRYTYPTPQNEQTPERLATIRVKITNDYFRSAPVGLVMIQSIIDRLLVWPATEQRSASA